MKNSIFIFLLLTIFAYLTIPIRVGDCMNIFKNDFEQQWDILSQDVENLNEYTKKHQVSLRKVKVEDRNLKGAIFIGANIEDVEWNNTNLEEANFSKTVFKNCKFLNSSHWNSSFTDVIFENCTFYGAEFSGSTMISVRFKGCKISDSRFKELTGDELIIEDTVIDERSSLAWSSIPMTFRKSTLDGVGMSGMKQHNAMIIEDSLLDEVDFGKSHFSDVILRRVKQGEGGVKFNEISANSIRFEDVNMTRGTAIARSQVKSVSVNGGNFGTTFDDSIIGQIFIRDANLYYMEFSEVKLPKVTITNCILYDTGMWDGYIEEFAVYNSEFNIIVGANFKADTAIWDNVTLDGKIDLTNAQIKDFRPTRLKRGPHLQLITTGSNIRL